MQGKNKDKTKSEKMKMTRAKQLVKLKAESVWQINVLSRK